MRLTDSCRPAMRFGTVMVSTASTASSGGQPAAPARERRRRNATSSTRRSSAKAAVLTTTAMNVVVGVGAPSYASGVHMWNGTALTLKREAARARAPCRARPSRTRRRVRPSVQRARAPPRCRRDPCARSRRRAARRRRAGARRRSAEQEVLERGFEWRARVAAEGDHGVDAERHRLEGDEDAEQIPGCREHHGADRGPEQEREELAALEPVLGR